MWLKGNYRISLPDILHVPHDVSKPRADFRHGSVRGSTVFFLPPLDHFRTWPKTPPAVIHFLEDHYSFMVLHTTLILTALLISSRAFSIPFEAGSSVSRNFGLEARRKSVELGYIGIDTTPFEVPTTTVRTPVEYVAEAKLPTDMGAFQLRAYRVPGGVVGQEPCVMYARDRPPFGKDGKLAENVPVRIHDQCLTSEVFGSQRCDCKEQLHMALEYVRKNGGCIIYLQQEGRGIGLANKVAAYSLQDDGYDTVDANLHLGFPEDAREYTMIPSILEDMGIGSIRLMTNNPRKVELLEALDVNIEDTIPVVVPETSEHNQAYIETKVTRMNHANMESLMSRKASASVRQQHLMTPQRVPIAEQYINNGTEWSANAIQVSLEAHQEVTEEEEGVTARDDGYCFGPESVEDAITAVRRGELVVVVDDMSRENEGDFIMAADMCTPEKMAEIVRYSSGVICIGMEGKRLDELGLPAMLLNNEDPKETAFTVTVDATTEHGITTGISARDRSKTVNLLANSSTEKADFHRPGHIFPLRAKGGGVLERDGHTEASVDLSRMAGRYPAGVLCEIVSEENPTEMMRLPEIKRFCRQHGYVLTSIVDMQQYRRDHEE